MILLKPINTKANFSYTKHKKARTIALPLGTILEVNLGKETVVVRNFWSGAKEKWMYNSDDTVISLNRGQMDRLMNNSNFKVMEKWKPCM